MKKLLVILLAVLLLCSCKAEIVDPREETSKGSEAEISEAGLSEEKLSEKQKNALKYITEREINGNSWSEALLKKDITASFEKVEFSDDRNWSAVLRLDKYGKTLDIPVVGIASYSNDYVALKYGAVSFIDEKTAVFCGKEKAFFFSTETSEPLDISLEIPVFEDGETWVNGVGYNEKSGEYILFATEISEKETEKKTATMFFYDENGKIESSRKTEVRGTSEDFEKVVPWFLMQTKLFEYRGETFLYDGLEIIGLESGTKIDIYSEINLENGDYGLKLLGCSLYGEEDDGVASYMAFLSKNGEVEKVMLFDENNFSNPQYSDTDELPTFAVNGDIVTYRDDYYAMTLTLDFAKQTHSIEYKPTDTLVDMEQEPITSSDGKYSIYTFGFNGAGDVFGYHLSLRNNETKSHKYLGESGGMYGGYNGIGFLKNSDIYIYSFTELRILDPETLETKFDINKNFPLYYDKETDSGRYLLTFRRNPNDFTYIVVYFEYENGIEWYYEGNGVDDNERGDCNYKIGFLDAEGSLIESYDTGAVIRSDPFGICSVDMRYSEKELRIFASDRRGQIVFEGVFNMETKKFTVNSPRE